jgi:UPF0755 protein
MAKKKKKGLQIGLLLFVIAFIVCGGIVWKYYGKIYQTAVSIDNDSTFLYIPSNWNRSDLISDLHQKGILKDTASFIWVANQKKFKTIKPGKYLLKTGMSNNSLVNLLRSGEQVPVNVTFNTIRTSKELAGKVGSQIEADSSELYKLLSSSDFAGKYGFNTKTFLTLFLPNTYEFYWNTNAEEFIKKNGQ